MKKGALLESLETVLVVTVITMLIWLYAEGETIITDTRKFKVQFVTPPTSGLAISLPDQAPGTTTITISATLQVSSGDRARIDELLRGGTLQIEVNVPTTDDELQTLNLLDALNNSPLADMRAFVKEVLPASQEVRVQTLELVDMGLSIARGELELSTVKSEEPVFSPEKIRVELPSKDAALVRSQNLKLTAHLDRLDPDTLSEDTQNNVSVELSLPPQLQDKQHITLTQETVNVKFILDKLTEQIELDRVQVRLNISDDITGQYRIEIDPGAQRFIPVTLKGPEEMINRIKDEPDLIRAQITIKHSDLQEDPPHSAPLYIEVPQGVTVVSPVPTQTLITYTVTDLTPQP
jgi:hypothetical protein